MPKAEKLSENEQLAEKRSFEGNCEIFLSRFFVYLVKPPGGLLYGTDGDARRKF